MQMAKAGGGCDATTMEPSSAPRLPVGSSARWWGRMHVSCRTDVGRSEMRVGNAVTKSLAVRVASAAVLLLASVPAFCAQAADAAKPPDVTPPYLDTDRSFED